MKLGNPLTSEGLAEEQRPLVAERFPATANQAICWEAAAAGPPSSAYQAAFTRRFEGQVSDRAIEAALQGIVDRHEILRTRFRPSEGGGLAQEVLREVVFKPAQVDLRHLPEPARKAEHDRLSKADAIVPFVLSGVDEDVPLMRVLLVRMAHDLVYMHIVFHQLVIDGWSVELLIDEIGHLAQAHDAGERTDPEPPALHFGDYARWQIDRLHDSDMIGSREYWRSKLHGIPDFSLEPDRPEAVRDHRGEIRSILLPRDLSDGFDTLARATNHTPFSLGAATAVTALHRLGGAPEIVFGTQLANREDADSEAVIGPLMNTVLIRHAFAAGDTFLNNAERLKHTMIEAMEHGSLPFGEVVRAESDAACSAGIRDYRVNFVVQRSNISSGNIGYKSFGDFRVIDTPSLSAGSPFDLSMFMVLREEGWRISCEGATALYDTATIDRLLSTWRGVIASAITDHATSLRQSPGPGPGGENPQRVATPDEPKDAVRHNPRIEALKQRITVLQPKGDGTPIIALNNTSVLYPVARAIGTDNPFIDIQFCPSPVRIPLPERHFLDHARDAVEMIRLARPHGPYVLFGLCILGAVALEAARILREEGEEVSLVVLNDTYRPGYREHMGFYDRNIRRLQVFGRTTKILHARYRAGEITASEWIDNYRIFRKLGLTRAMRKLGLAAPAEVRDVVQDHNRWFPEEILLPSQARYEIAPFDGRVALFRNEELQEGRLFPRDFGWRGYLTGPFMVADCPGTHDTMFRAPGAAVIGSVIRRALAEETARSKNEVATMGSSL